MNHGVRLLREDDIDAVERGRGRDRRQPHAGFDNTVHDPMANP